MNLICRTCLQINKKYVSIFDYHENGKMLSDMLVDCTPIKIQKSDGLPLYICNCCLEKLSSVWDFRVMVTKTDLKLRVMFNKHLKETIIQNNNSFTDTTVVKEESIIVKNEIASSLIQESISKTNTCRSESSLEKMVNVSSGNHANFLNDKSNEENASIKNTSNENNSDNVIPEITVTEEVKNSKKKEQISSKHCARTNKEVEVTCNVKQNTTSDLLNFADIHYASENFVDQNISEDCVSNGHANSIEFIQKTGIWKQEAETPNICRENNLIFREDDLTLDDNSQYSDESIDNYDISNESNVKEELSSEKVNKKLTRKEKERMSVLCKTCNRSFGYRYYFEIHVKHHNGDKKCKCDICGKAFVRQFQLRLHMAVHSDERPISCETCGKTFKNRSALCSHKTIHGDGTLFTCSICQKSYKSKSSLKSHFQRHKCEKKYTCEVCGKSFSDSSAFRRHKLTHVDGKNFVCPTCGKTFSTNLLMRAHLKLHTEARPHSCSYCGKSFKTKDVMDTHILIHTGERPYLCKICDKSFRQTSALYNHMRIHTGETPYACDLCPSQFKYSHHLQNHMKVHK